MIEERAVHPWNVDLGILVMVVGRVMVWRDLHPRNIDAPMMVVKLLSPITVLDKDNGDAILVFVIKCLCDNGSID